MRQIWNVGTNNYVADYIYDHNGIPMAFALSTNGGAYVYYFYETNLHGDITAIFDANGTILVRFAYDAWGNFQQTGNISDVLSNAILFRYRSYIYDSEIGLYYLQTRYYDSQTGRFLNVDGALYHHMLGYNLYAYCYNNPVNYVDYTGENAQAAKTIWESILGLFGVSLVEPTPFGEIAVGGLAVVGLIATAAILLTSDSDENTDSEVIGNKRQPDSLPTEGEPNSDQELYDEKGIKQKRHYGPDGKAEYDIDYRHPGKNHKFPHKHEWDWGKIKPRGDAIDLF